jgi:hypothetical protein
MTVNADPGQCSAVINYTITANDNCPGVTTNMFTGLASGAAFPIGYTLVQYTATDAAGNTATWNFDVQVNDNQAPTITCPASLSVSNSVGVCGANVTFNIGATDNCGIPSVTTSANSGDFFPIGTTTVTATALDANNLQATCSFTVTVNDTELPTITCPSAMTVNADPGQCNAVINYTITANDNCPGVTTNLFTGLASGAAFPIGYTLVQYTATDAAGNTATCNFDVQVDDNQAPVITCPANISVGNGNGLCGANVIFLVIGATDNCGIPSVTTSANSGDFFPIGTTTVTATALDANNLQANCSFTVTVNDTELPSIACPSAMTVNADPGQCSAVINYSITANDNCPGVTTNLFTGLASGAAFLIGYTLVQYTATDAAGNTATCNFDVQVDDNQAPTITCPANISVSNGNGLCGANVTFNIGATDNCGIPSLTTSANSGDFFAIGTTTVTATALDANNLLATCSFTVTVNDTEAPTITCPSAMTVNADPGQCSAVINYTITANDNCPGVTTNLFTGLASGAAFPIGYTLVQYTATDAAGNTATCNFERASGRQPSTCHHLPSFARCEQRCGCVRSECQLLRHSHRQLRLTNRDDERQFGRFLPYWNDNCDGYGLGCEQFAGYLFLHNYCE